MKYFIRLFFIFLITPVFGINEYPYLKTGFIANGETENSVKCFTDVIGGVGHISPTIYTISEDGKIYVADDLNKRITIFDLNTNYIKQIKNASSALVSLLEIKVTNDEIICLRNTDEALFKINLKGEIIFLTPSKELPANIYAGHAFFPCNDYTFYSDEKYNLKCLDPSGKKMDDSAINKLKQDIDVKQAGSEGLRSVASFKSKMSDFLNKESLMISSNDTLLSNNIEKYKQFWKLLRQNNDIQSFAKSSTTNRSLNEDLGKYSDNAHTFLGNDTDGNSYWGATINGPAFVVVSKYGKVLDTFKRDKINYSNPQVAPNGDIYFWKIAKDGVTFYKITRRW